MREVLLPRRVEVGAGGCRRGGLVGGEVEAGAGAASRRGIRRGSGGVVGSLVQVGEAAGLRAVGAVLDLLVAGEAEVVGPLGSHCER